jgi:hypothetical protein
MNLIDHSQTELRISTPSIWQSCRIRNIQIHRQVVHVVSFREYQYSPVNNTLKEINHKMIQTPTNATHKQLQLVRSYIVYPPTICNCQQ